MKYLILTFYYKPDLSAGSFRTTSLVNELKKVISPDDEVTVLTTLPNRYNTFSEVAKKEEIDKKIRIIRFALSNHKSGIKDQAIAFYGFFKQVLSYIKNKDFEIVFATSSRLFTAFLGAVVSRRKKSVLLLDIRDIFKDTLKSILNPLMFLFLSIPLNIIENYTFRKASKINLVSGGFKEYFTKRFPKAKYTFYSNGIDEEFYNYDFTKEVSGKKVITYAGNIGQGQGLENIIPDLAEYLGEGYEIRVIGDGGRKETLLEEIEKKKVNNVKMINPVRREELLKYYRESDFLFLHLNNVPAFKKVLPSKIFEYAITQKSIIAGVDGFARKFLKEYIPDSFVFNPCSLESFIEVFNPEINEKKHFDSFLEKYRRTNIMSEMVKEYFK